MKRELYLAGLVLLLTSATAAQDNMAGMRMQSPAATTSLGEDLPVLDLLGEAKTAPAMKLEDFEGMAPPDEGDYGAGKKGRHGAAPARA